MNEQSDRLNHLGGSMAPPTNSDDEQQPVPSLLGDAERLYVLGCSALRSESYEEAAECFSKALEIRVQQHGELAPECATTYYKFGCALLYKVQAESDALVVKDDREESPCRAADGEESKEKEEEDEDEQDDDEENPVSQKGETSGNREGSTDMQEAGGDADNGGGEEEGDLLLAWEMLDIARIIYSKEPQRTLAEVDAITTLADVSLEREVFQMCFEDYEEALRMLETLVEADSRRIAELCFKISVAKQLDQKPKEALKYCERAVSVCESRVERLNKELAEANLRQVCSNGHSLEGGEEAFSKESIFDNVCEGGEESVKAKSLKEDNSPLEVEVKEIEELLVDLRQKVEELQEMALAPSLFDVFKSANPEAADLMKQAYGMTVKLATQTDNGGFSSSLAGASSSTAPVTNLGVVGRGVKRAVPTPISEEKLLPPDTQSAKRTTEERLNGGNSAESQIIFEGSS